MSKKCKYYVVKQGRSKGIFDNWASCLSVVCGVTNSYCGCKNWHEVQEQVLFEMPDEGPYVCEIKERRIRFITYGRFRDYVLSRDFDQNRW